MLEQTGEEPVALGSPTAPGPGAGSSRVQDFLGSQAYKDFQGSQANQMGTTDMYNSPYFGSMSSGSSGRAQDRAYEQWLASNSAGGAPGAPTTPGAPASPVGAATGGLDPSQSTLSPNFASYVYDMLGKGQAAANQPFQPFTGERFAGASPLQQQAFQGIGGLQVPGQFGQAAGIAGNVAATAGGLSYKPQEFSSQFQAPGQYQAGQFSNLFQAPGQYQAGQFKTGLGSIGSVADYMSPYTSGVTDIAAREATRQADISRNAEQARLSQAGAYGGSRQAIMEAERQRNLGTQIGDIRTQGLQSAYDRAVAQRQQEAQLGLQAQQYGEQSRQFGAGQGMTAAQAAAQYGQAAQQASEASRQFGAGQAMAGAQSTAQYGLEAQRAGEASRQFGANYGLQGLDKQLTAAQTLGSLGSQQQQAQTGLANLQLNAGEIQQKQAQAPLDFGYQQWQESLKQPYQQASYMQSLLQGLPLQARAYDSGQSSSAGAMQGGLSALALYQALMEEKK